MFGINDFNGKSCYFNRSLDFKLQVFNVDVKLQLIQSPLFSSLHRKLDRKAILSVRQRSHFSDSEI